MKHRYIGSSQSIRPMLNSLFTAMDEQAAKFSLAYFIQHLGTGILLGAFVLVALPAFPVVQIVGMAVMYPFARCGADALGQFAAENSAMHKWASSKSVLKVVFALQGEVLKTLLAAFFAATGWLWIGLVALFRWAMSKRKAAQVI